MPYSEVQIGQWHMILFQFKLCFSLSVKNMLLCAYFGHVDAVQDLILADQISLGAQPHSEPHNSYN